MNTNPINNQYRRIIIRRGNEYLLFKTDEIAYFFLENKTCYMVDRIQGIKYLISKSLRDLTMALDPADFYRINKKYLVHIVQRGDTLASIAQNYNGVTVQQIKALNRIAKGRALRVGSKLKVPVSS